jgi:hypothetical protein
MEEYQLYSITFYQNVIFDDYPWMRVPCGNQGDQLRIANPLSTKKSETQEKCKKKNLPNMTCLSAKNASLSL